MSQKEIKSPAGPPPSSSRWYRHVAHTHTHTPRYMHTWTHATIHSCQNFCNNFFTCLFTIIFISLKLILYSASGIILLKSNSDQIPAYKHPKSF